MEESKLNVIYSQSPNTGGGAPPRNAMVSSSPAVDDQADGLLVFLPRGSKFRQGRFPDIVDFSAEMRETEQILRNFVGESARLEIEWPKESVSINIDTSSMLKILLMLLANSVEAPLPADRRFLKKQIFVRSFLSRAPYWLADDIKMGSARYIETTVRDNGSGIEPDVLPHIFKPGFSTRPPALEEDPRERQARGFGLTMVKQLVQDAGGRLQVVSAPPFGTRVDLAFPSIAEGRFLGDSCGDLRSSRARCSRKNG